jgi:molybdate transport system regulatory protein
VSDQNASLGVRLRIDFGPHSSIGPGKIALLERIEATGSLSQAARELGMSYRRAWLLVDDLNHALAEPVTRASVGGAGGGGARLTPFGRKLIAAYRDVEHASFDAAAARLAGLAKPARRVGETSGSAISSVERRPLSRPLARLLSPAGARAHEAARRPPVREAPQALDTHARAARRSSRAPKGDGRRKG